MSGYRSNSVNRHESEYQRSFPHSNTKSEAVNSRDIQCVVIAFANIINGKFIYILIQFYCDDHVAPNSGVTIVSVNGLTLMKTLTIIKLNYGICYKTHGN